MKQWYRLSLALAGFMVLGNFSTQDNSIAGREKPHINFYGTLVDTEGQQYNVENITISGIYKQIPFYKKPADKSINPTIHITRIDFAETKKISVPHPQDILIFDNRSYIEVTITTSDGKVMPYIIEKSKRLMCDEISKAGGIEKDLSFQALQSIEFHGHKTPEPKDASAKEKPVE